MRDTYLQSVSHLALNAADVLLEDVERIAQIIDRRVQADQVGGKADKVLIIPIDEVVHRRLQDFEVKAQIFLEGFQRDAGSPVLRDEFVHFEVGLSKVVLVEGQRRRTTVC